MGKRFPYARYSKTVAHYGNEDGDYLFSFFVLFLYENWELKILILY